MDQITGNITRRATGWVVNLRINGKRRQLSAKTKTEAELRLAEALRRPEQAQVVTASRGGYTLAKAMNDAINHVWQGQVGEKTAITYCEAVVMELGSSTRVEDVTFNDAEAMLVRFEKLGNQPQTINAKLSKLRIMRDMAVRFGGVQQLPPIPKNRPLNNKQTQVWSKEQIRTIVSDLWSRNKQEEASLFLFLCEMGCRFSEAKRIKGRHVDLQRGTVEFFKVKKDHKEGNRVLKLTPTAWECIKPYVPVIPDHGVWSLKYDALDFQVRTSMARNGIAMERPLHTCRHTCGSNLGLNGLSEFSIARWLGHSDTQTTQRYVHLNQQANDPCYEALAASSAGGISNLVNAADS